MFNLKSIFIILLGLGSVNALAGTVTTDGADLIIDTKKGLSVKTADGDFSIKLGGRIQWDYNQAQLNNVTDEDDFDVRRARIYVKGHSGDWSYKAQFNVGDSKKGGTPEDLYIQYNGWGKGLKATAGNQRVQMGLEDLTSSNNITALERSGITEQYAIGREESLRLHGAVDNLFYSLSAFEDRSAADENDFGFAGRVALAPVNTDDLLVHLGFNYADRAGDHTVDGFEFAAVAGSVHLQAEHFTDERGLEEREGSYVQVGWILTGETRPYKKGVFKRVKPQAAGGAWEVFARVKEGDGKHSDIELGSEDASAYTVGLNWYATSKVRIGANYSEGESNEAGSTDEGEEFRLRAQLVF